MRIQDTQYIRQGNNFPDLSPPWKSPDAWHEANWSVGYLAKHHCNRLKGFVALFQDVKGRLSSIFPVLDELCANTCPWCPDPCCLSATVWFDFSDLLFLQSSGQEIPPSQPQQDLKIICRYCGPRGCMLPRMSRPWICTRYLCDSQLAHLRKRDTLFQETFGRAVQTVRDGRREMEDEFIRVVSTS